VVRIAAAQPGLFAAAVAPPKKTSDGGQLTSLSTART